MKRLIVLLVMLALSIMLLAGCSDDYRDSSGRTICAYCNGVGYIGNGAKNAKEWSYMKTVCPRCGGSGYRD